MDDFTLLTAIKSSDAGPVEEQKMFVTTLKTIAFRACAVIMLAACAANDDVTSPVDANDLALNKQTTASSLTVALSLGERTQLRVSDARYTPTWSSSASSVASVDKNGVVTGVGVGSATVTARHRFWRTDFLVSVMAPTVASVQVTPSLSTIAVGANVQLSATARTASGSTISGKTVTYSSSAPSVLSVTNSGLVTAIATGSAAISATVDGISASATITVTPPPVTSLVVALSTASLVVGGTTQATVTARSSDNQIVQNVVAAWSVPVGPTVVSVSTGGIITALSQGTAQVRACVDGVCGSAAISVTAPQTQPPIATALSFPMTVSRFHNGSGATVVSAGIPLRPGALLPSQLINVRLFKGNVEQSIYVEELPRRHQDGSVRSILVQVDAGTMSYGVPDTSWRLVLDQGARVAAGRQKVAIDFVDVPVGMLYYSKPSDRVSSNLLLGPTRTIAESPSREPYLKYHSTAALNGNNYAGIKGALDALWSLHSQSLSAGAFYNGDAGWANLHYWVRGGDVVYLERFLRYARKYIAENPTTGGLEWQKWYRTPRSHYWLTGDVRSVNYVRAVADADWSSQNGGGDFAAPNYKIDQRAYSQHAGMNLSAWLVGAGDEYRTRSRSIFDAFVRFGMAGPTPGVHYYKDQKSIDGCVGQKPFMTGLMHTYMIEHVENAEPSLRPAFLQWLRTGLEQLWRQRDPRYAVVSAEYPGFAYFWSPELESKRVLGDTMCSAVYPQGHGVSRGSDGYNIEAFAYLGFHTNSATDIQRAETVFASHNLFMGAWAGFEGLQAMYNDWSIFGYMR
ncbi:MAG: Ig-like domain-containing protein [Gemmatimonadaceae bacterium]|nr:Ig-like domain-containing protein [Gemmatimonadaceae bacterium]